MPAVREAEAVLVSYDRPPPSIRRELAAAWRDRALIPRLGSRVVVKTYIRTILGRLWLVIRPFMDSIGLALIFGAVVGIEAPAGIPYLVFLLIGLFGWRLFERSLFWSTRAFDRFARIVRSLDPPLLVLPIAGAAPAFVEAGIYFVIVVGALLVYLVADGQFYVEIGPELLVGVAGLGLCLAFALGLGLTLSILNARARDVRLGLRYVLDIWLFVTPVLYPLEQLPSGFRTLAQVNPLAPMVEMVRYGFLGTGTPSAGGVAWAVVATGGAIAFGLWFVSYKAPDFLTELHGTTADDEEEEDLR